MNTLRFATALALLAGTPLDAADGDFAPPDFETNPTPDDPQRFITRFAPFRTEWAALSPDGRHIAYSVREGEDLSVVVIAIDDPGTARARVLVASDETSTPALELEARERTPAAIRWLGFVGDERILVETNRNFATLVGETWSNVSGAILGFDIHGGDARIVVTPRDVARTEPSAASATTGTSAFARILTPDRPRPAGDVAAPQEEREFPLSEAPADEFVHVHASPRIFDFAPAHAGSVLVRTDTLPRYDVYRLDAVSGKLHYVRDHVTDGDRRVLLDRQGFPRASIPASLAFAFPHRWGIARSGLGRRWIDLDEVVAPGGADAAFHVSPDTSFTGRSVPLGFDEDSTVLYFASNAGRDTVGIYSMDTKTGERGRLAVESPTLDLLALSPGGAISPGTLVHDRHTRALAGIRHRGERPTASWLRTELQSVQRGLQSAFPGRTVELLEWDATMNRILVRISDADDPGAFFVFTREDGRLAEFVRVEPLLAGESRHRTAAFSLTAPAGHTVAGAITLPAAPRVRPSPLVVLLSDHPWTPTEPVFDRRVHAFADMGFAVLRVDPRGTGGRGLAHLHAASGRPDEVQTEDIVFVVDRLAAKLPIDRERVALVGSHYGGRLAVRGLQLRPERFRCAVAIESPVDLDAWFEQARWAGDVSTVLEREYFGDASHRKATSLLREPELVRGSLLLLAYGGPAGQPRRETYLAARRLARTVGAGPGTAVFVELDHDFAANRTASRARVFRRMERFLNSTLYDFAVEEGELRVAPE